MAAVFASEPGEAIMEDAAIEIAVNDQFDIRPKEAILPGKTLIINLFKSLKMILNTLKTKKLEGKGPKKRPY